MTATVQVPAAAGSSGGVQGLHPLLAGRYSTRSFDVRHDIDQQQLVRLLEAARWAPSASNSQPWRFVVGRRGDHVFERLVSVVLSTNRLWAPRASALILALAETVDPGGQIRRHAVYDVGQAVAHLTVQAEADGLGVRQIGGFSVDDARAVFSVGPKLEPLTILAVGMRTPARCLPATLLQREAAPRERRPVSASVLAGPPALTGLPHTGP